MFDEAFFDDKIQRIAEAVVERLPGPKVAQRYFSFEQAGEYMGVTKEAIRAYAKQGFFPIIAKGGKLRWVDKEDIDAFMRKVKR